MASLSSFLVGNCFVQVLNKALASRPGGSQHFFLQVPVPKPNPLIESFLLIETCPISSERSHQNIYLCYYLRNFKSQWILHQSFQVPWMAYNEKEMHSKKERIWIRPSKEKTPICLSVEKDLHYEPVESHPGLPGVESLWLTAGTSHIIEVNLEVFPFSIKIRTFPYLAH